MPSRHLRLVPPLDDASFAVRAARALGDAADYVRRRGGSIEITVTDSDGVELPAEPAACDESAFVVRAEAHFRTLRSETVIVGISEPILKEEFIAGGQAGYLSAQAEAVHDLMVQIRPRHPSEAI